MQEIFATPAREERLKEKEKRIKDWESANYCGLMLSFGEARERFALLERGYPLNVKPREIDVLIRTDEDYSNSGNAILRSFRKHNIIELKNPTELLNIDTLCNVYSYALQYKSMGETVDAIQLGDIAITILRAAKPRELFAKLQRMGYTVKCEVPGIYYVSGLVDIPLQVVVASELEGEEFLALRVLKRNAKKEELRNFVHYSDSRTRKDEKEMADAVLQVSMTVNKNTYAELKEEETMCDALRELMKPEIEQEMREAKAKGRAEGIAKGIAEGIEERIAEGIAEGKARKGEEMVAEMLKGNEPLSKIEKYTKIAAERIAEIANSIGVTPVAG